MVKKKVKITDLKEYIWTTHLSHLCANNNQTESILFSEIYDDIRRKYGHSGKTTKVPTCFLTLLHIANEKGLNIVKEGSDLRISKIIKF